MDDPSAPNETETALTQVGARVRQLRVAAGLTVVDLARTSEVSRRMLTLIEARKANPSVLILDRLAAALGTDLATLLLPATPMHGDAEAADAALKGDTRDRIRAPVRFPAADTVQVIDLPHGGSARLHARTPNRLGPELWTWSLAPGDCFDVEATSERADLLFHVTAGTLSLRTHTPEVDLTLGVGDSAWLTTDVSHRYANSTDKSVEFTQISHAVPR